jgi:hypothetical protein
VLVYLEKSILVSVKHFFLLGNSRASLSPFNAYSISHSESKHKGVAENILVVLLFSNSGNQDKVLLHPLLFIEIGRMKAPVVHVEMVHHLAIDWADVQHIISGRPANANDFVSNLEFCGHFASPLIEQHHIIPQSVSEVKASEEKRKKMTCGKTSHFVNYAEPCLFTLQHGV